METKFDFENNQEILNIIVNSGLLPRYIYKYTTLESLILVLESSKIKFSKPSEFNDPFDCNLTIDTNNTSEEIDNHINQIAGKHKLSFEQINILKEKFHDPVEHFNITSKSVKDAKEALGVSCFSKINNNLIMWAHYSNKHKGVCLKFDILADTHFFMTPVPIVYTKDYPVFNYIRNRESIGKFLLETKSFDWEYEQEIRIMKEGAGFYEFKKASLVEIILGVRTTKDELNKIIQLITDKAYRNIEFMICTVCENKFELEIKKMN